MAKGKNVVVLEGNLAKEPDIRQTGRGTTVATLRVATSTESQKQADGSWKDQAQYHSVVVWGREAQELASAKVGDGIEVLGMLTHRSYDAQDGSKRWVSEVKASVVKLRPKDKQQGQGSYAPAAGGDIPF